MLWCGGRDGGVCACVCVCVCVRARARVCVMQFVSVGRTVLVLAFDCRCFLG